MAKAYACPKCGRDVPLDKINVAKDIILCPAYGETSCFSDVVGEIDERRHADDVRGRLNGAPPKHLKVECNPMDPTGSFPGLHLTHSGSSAMIHICAGMDEDSLDYVEAVLKREVSRV